MKKIIGLFLLVLGIWTGAIAQQDFQYTQFMFNKMSFNPAYAGTKGHWLLSAIYRKQWFGIDRAPQTATFNAHGAIAKKRVGLGLSINYDQIGFSDRVGIETNYSYIIPFKNDSFLSFGLRGGVYYRQIRWDEADLIDQDDAAIPMAATSLIVPNFGAGIYYQSKSWYIGLSAPHLFVNQGDFNIASSSGVVEPDFTQHFYAMGGFMFGLTEGVQIQQNLLVKYVMNAPASIDINVSFVFVERVLFGVTYRVGDSVDALLQWQISPQLRIAAAYDFSITNLQRYNSGSIEAMISYWLVKDTDKQGQYHVGNHRFF
jgi:type IX secretion system PorP/SprF family membrane protein